MDETLSNRLQALTDAVEAQQQALSQLTNLVELQGEMIVALIEGRSIPHQSNGTSPRLDS